MTVLDTPLTVCEVAAMSGCSVPTIYRRFAENRGPRTFRQGRLRLVTRADFADWLATLRAPTSAREQPSF
jgi:excisionase family DNA binding protein